MLEWLLSECGGKGTLSSQSVKNDLLKIDFECLYWRSEFPLEGFYLHRNL